MRGSNLLAAVLSGLVLCSVASASEFGNIFGNAETSAASRAASAKALEAIEHLVAGLRARELSGGENRGAEEFGVAAQYFAEAADQMDKLLGDFPDKPLSDAQVASLKSKLAPGSQEYVLVENSKSLRDLYQGFSARTRQMSALVGGLAGQRNAFAAISPALIKYFRLADGIVTAQAG
ncbi:hypothetical protein NKI95_12105 [Mesorhizobium sp. M0306]|uniref:hypothetical protein n=1 Tax=Mesorhizobium sp. M0306 TaxID=2956932 RepID=UPI003336DD86